VVLDRFALDGEGVHGAAITSTVAGAAIESLHDPRGMHRLRLRPVPVPGLQHQEVDPPSRLGVDPLLRREGTSRNGWQPTADALLNMERLRQRMAARGNGFGLFPASLRRADLPADCRRLRPRGSIKAPPFVVSSGKAS
jgi:hypothetical protein